MKRKRIIYSDSFSLDDWRDWLAEEHPDVLDESDQWDLVANENAMYLDDERANLDKVLDGYVVADCYLELWLGRREVVRVLDSKLNSIFNYGEDINEWYVEDGEVWAKNAHHDGTNFVNYRFLPREVSEFYDKWDEGEIDDAELLARTTSLAPFVCEVYGWKE